MNLVMTSYPSHSPIIPATPANTGGAGTGSLKIANTKPQPKPVKTENIISFIFLLFENQDGQVGWQQ